MWLKSLSCVHLNNVLLSTSRRCLGTTPTIYLNQKWRQEKGLPLNPNSCGVLTDGPDYSYLDGRPTPYGVGQKERIRKNQELTEQIIKLAGEIDFAVERHNKLLQEKEDRKQKTLDNKLKPKGVELLKKKKQ